MRGDQKDIHIIKGGKMEKLLIRKATIDDVQYISLLARMTFTEAFQHYYRDRQDLLDYYEREFSVSKIQSSLLKDNNAFWIAFYDQLPVGYSKLKKHSKTEFINSGKVSQLQKIYVLQDFNSRKIGFRLLNEMLEETKRMKNKYLWLSVLKSNERALSFYTKSGFNPAGEHSYAIGKEHFEFFVLKRKVEEKIKIVSSRNNKNQEKTEYYEYKK
jgi:ribosomal protein S18 acetylase RimI-like enzyme